MNNFGITYFEDEQENSLGTIESIINLCLYKGMKIKIHSHGNSDYKVIDWYYIHGHPDENAGLHIILK